MNTVWWWGVQVKLRHDDVNIVAGGGTVAAGLLAGLGVTSWVAALVLAVAAWIKAADKGSGVYFYVTWAGVWWIGSV